MDLALIIKKLNLSLTTPKEATPVNQTSTTDWQMAVRRDNINFLNQIRYFSIN